MTATVLVVDDEPDVTDVYELWLDDYDVLVANSGSEALSILDRRGDDVDVTLLDRKMPGTSGDAVLAEVRAREVECQVAMITAVAPSLDIVDMPFDDYATKPVSGADLRELVESLLERADYTDALDRYFRLITKHALLTEQRPMPELRENEGFLELEAELRAVERELEGSVDFGDHQQFQYALRDVVSGD